LTFTLTAPNKEGEQIAAADRLQHLCFTPTTLQSPGGWARRSIAEN